MSKLSNAQIEEALSGLPGWAHQEKTTLNSIRKVFKFKDFREAWAFMTRVATLADEADHHPEWSNAYNRVEIVLSTHDKGGVTGKDISLAQAIESVVNLNA